MTSGIDSVDFQRSLIWVIEGTSLLSQSLGQVEPPDLSQATLLDGWSQAHIVAHLARNAEALGNLLTWARTDVPTPMYRNPGSRSTDIDTTAKATPGELVADFNSTAAELQILIDRLRPSAWEYQVVSALGRPIAVSEVPWLRSREIWLHGVDLNVGITFSCLPLDLTTALISDIVNNLSTKPGCPSLDLVSPTTRWHLGPSQTDEEAVATGKAVRTCGPATNAAAWSSGTSVAGADGNTLADDAAPSPFDAVRLQEPLRLVSGNEALLLEWLSGRSDGAALDPNPLPLLPSWI